jgi:hypothetical protein
MSSHRCRTSFHGRSGPEIRDSTSAYYARGASRARAVGALTLFEGRRTFLRS